MVASWSALPTEPAGRAEVLRSMCETVPLVLLAAPEDASSIGTIDGNTEVVYEPFEMSDLAGAVRHLSTGPTSAARN